MTEYTHKVDVTIVVERCCDCRRHFGHEKHEPAWCPHCAKDALRKLNERITALEKSNAALRGALTRKK